MDDGRALAADASGRSGNGRRRFHSKDTRDTVYPAVGKWRADCWLARQVAGFVWRVPLAWGLLVAVFIAGRFAADTFAPPASYSARSFFTTWSSILLYLMAGAGAPGARAVSGPACCSPRARLLLGGP